MCRAVDAKSRIRVVGPVPELSMAEWIVVQVPPANVAARSIPSVDPIRPFQFFKEPQAIR